MEPKPEPDQDRWSRKVLEDLVNASLKEQRAARRWGVFFKLLLFLYLFAGVAIWAALTGNELALTSEKHSALVDLKGVIASENTAAADNVVKGLREAFKHQGTKGVILRINSPGGSPVQSAYIHDEIHRLRNKYPKIPVYAVIADICASGGYYVASAADKIYANESSIVGSIGVLMNGFGFVKTMDTLGVERRLLTAGEHKALLDPFSPLKEEEKAHVQRILDKLHDQFITAVKMGRGERLKQDDRLFSGLFWSGREGKELGLVDGFGSAGYVAREVIGEEEIVDFTKKEDLLERFAARLGESAAQMLMNWSGGLGNLR